MRKFDTDGLSLSKRQGDIFEKSMTKFGGSSEVFVRRFMLSKIAKDFDSLSFLGVAMSDGEVFDELDRQYGESNYGKGKYGSEALYWVGYIYRYFCYTYEIDSKTAYKLIKPRELFSRYYVYHTFDPAFAIDRILEEKGIDMFSLDPNSRLLDLMWKKEIEKSSEVIESDCLNQEYEKILKIVYDNNDLFEATYKTNANHNLRIQIVEKKIKGTKANEAAFERLIAYIKEYTDDENIEIIMDNPQKSFVDMLKKYGYGDVYLIKEGTVSFVKG